MPPSSEPPESPLRGAGASDGVRVRVGVLVGVGTGPSHSVTWVSCWMQEGHASNKLYRVNPDANLGDENFQFPGARQIDRRAFCRKGLRQRAANAARCPCNPDCLSAHLHVALPALVLLRRQTIRSRRRAQEFECRKFNAGNPDARASGGNRQPTGARTGNVQM